MKKGELQEFRDITEVKKKENDVIFRIGHFVAQLAILLSSSFYLIQN